ncbi:hypothetical protein HJC23_007369 [Cyclotella cryptica]|uniref:RING-type domain-containing protein n=1 Tax=Cyclotella cryptica TaxID=29204 RepID=A0ABD3Q6B9_9STRA
MGYHGEYYGHLSAERKQEIDNLRSMALLRYLTNFTRTLKEEDMTVRSPTEREVVDFSSHEAACDDGDNGNGSTSERDETHIEEGCPIEEAKQEIKECSSEYTHVLIPLPGQRIDGKDVKHEDDPGNGKRKKAKNTKASWYLSPSKIKVLNGISGNKEESADNISSTETVVASTENDVAPNSTPEKRAVPIFCAVCLTEYEVSERVCWSSNTECTHVFHEDCIVQWLVSSGRTKSKRQWFPDNPSERRLMCYELECPCCRQEFISKEARAESGEESV